MVPLLEYTEDVIPIGLQDNLVFNAPDFPVTESDNIPGTAFWVQCQSVPGAQFIGSVNASDPTYMFHVHDDLQDVAFVPSE